MKLRSIIVRKISWFVAAVVILVTVLRGYEFLPIAEYGDGFAMQLASAEALVSVGAASVEGGDESWLPLLHVVRLAAVTPFLIVEEAVGPAAPVALLLLLLLPLVRVPTSNFSSPLTLLPICLPLAVSGRSVLVAVAIGYVVMSLLERRRYWMLWIGAILANLSSAAVLACLILLAVDSVATARKSLSRFQQIQRLIAFLLLLLSLSVSAVDKLAGATIGSIGYEAYAFATDNLLIQMISRSTLAVSIVEGQHLRALVYLAVVFLLLVGFVRAYSDPRKRLARRTVICCAPGIFMEGLGTVGMVFPVIWLLAGVAGDSEQPALTTPRPP